MEAKGKNLEVIQMMNRKLLLKLLQQNLMCSRANLAAQSGLKQATITNIVNDFISWGLVEETGLIEGQKGRRAIGIHLRDDRFFVIGIRLSRKYFDIGIFTLMGNLVGEKYRSDIIDTSPMRVIASMQKIGNQLIQENPDKQIVAIGVSVPGPYYCHEGVIETITNFPGWDRIPLLAELQKDFAVPVILDHDANAGVLAECSFKVDPEQYKTVVYVAVGQGIGAGIYHNGEIFRGAAGIAGEIGHTSIDIHGPVCECGNHGCLTVYVSTLALLKNANAALEQAGKPVCRDFNELIEKIQKGEKEVYQEFKDTMRYLSTGLLNLIYSYNPSLIILGDEMSRIGPLMIQEIKEVWSGLKKSRVIEQAELCLTSFDEDPAFVGAAEVAIDYVFGHTELLRQK